MFYLSGAVMDRFAVHPQIGFMYTPLMGNVHRPGIRWGADNGCFTRPDLFDEGRYFDWLEVRGPYRQECLFVTARDSVGNAEATLDLSLPMLPRIRALGYQAALVFQDGLECLPVPWDAFDVAFVGGTNAFKLSENAYSLIAEAKRRGKWCHQGRVNSLRRLRTAQVSGFDSADGTYLKFGPDKNLSNLVGWLLQIERQPPLGPGERIDR